MSIRPDQLLGALRASGVEFFTGVPDSLLRPFCDRLASMADPRDHVAACNEAAAVGIAIGYHLATGRIPCVYLQNSGLGNAVNPLTSLACGEVYSIPMVLLVGWRGEIGSDGAQVADEPQHRKQGRATLAQLDLLDTPHRVVGGDEGDLDGIVAACVGSARERRAPAALVFRRRAFLEAHAAERTRSTPALSREDAIRCCLDALGSRALFVTTTGMASREVYEIRSALRQPHDRDFLTVGGMGLASQIAFGLSLHSDQPVVCLDGDGAMLMHMGGVATCAGSRDLLHVLLNNGVHDSVGAQATSAGNLSFTALARAAGYRSVRRATDVGELRDALAGCQGERGSRFVEVVCSPGHRTDLGRPTQTPRENKSAFMRRVDALSARRGAAAAE